MLVLKRDKLHSESPGECLTVAILLQVVLVLVPLLLVELSSPLVVGDLHSLLSWKQHDSFSPVLV